MISRIMLSLKKAADSAKNAWSLTGQNTYGVTFQSTFNIATPRTPAPRTDISGKDDFIPLDTFLAV
jgi:hypothetical protein